MSRPRSSHRSRVLALLAARLWSGPWPLAAQDPLGQFWPPYLESAWTTIKHDPFGSNFSQFRYAPEHDTRKVKSGGSWAAIDAVPFGRGGGLNDVALFTSAIVDDPADRVYLTNGKHGRDRSGHATAGRPHLVAYRRNGTVAWTSDAWADSPNNWIDPETFDAAVVTRADLRYLDSTAVTSSVIVDRNRNVYIADNHYLWKSDADGNLLWKWRMPAETADGSSYPFVTAFFTATGEVGGVHLSGRVSIFADNGSRAALVTSTDLQAQTGNLQPQPAPPRLRLPPELAGLSSAELIQECLYYPGLVNGQPATSGRNPQEWMADPALVLQMAAGFLGGGMPVANTPAVHAAASGTTRIYVPVNLPDADGDGLYDTRVMRVDFTGGPEPSLRTAAAWRDRPGAGLMAAASGSATSPNLSADGSVVFCGANNGTFHAFRTDTGDPAWPSAPAVGPIWGAASLTWAGPDPASKASLYVGSMGRIHEIDALTGAHRVPLSFNLADALAEGRRDIQELYRLPTGELMPALGARNQVMPSAVLSSMVTSTVDQLSMVIVLGYQLLADSPSTFLPVKSMAVLVPRDGSWTFKVVGALKDVGEGAIAPNRDGDLWVHHAATMSSFAAGLCDKYPWVLAALGLRYVNGRDLADRFDGYLDPLEPSGGLTWLPSRP